MEFTPRRRRSADRCASSRGPSAEADFACRVPARAAARVREQGPGRRLDAAAGGPATCAAPRRSSKLPAQEFSARSRRSQHARWSLTPSANDFVAEIVTTRCRRADLRAANSEPEDIPFFNRRTHRNIAIYPSEEKLATRGRFFSEDDRRDYDVDALRDRNRRSPPIACGSTERPAVHSRALARISRR
jgi:hypothetical protein